MRLINLVRDSPNAAYALKSIVNGSAASPDSGSLTEIDVKSATSDAVSTGSTTGMIRPMSIKEFLKLQLQENGSEAMQGSENSPCGSPTGGNDLCSDAEYFTPLSSPDESRRSSVEALPEEVSWHCLIVILAFYFIFFVYIFYCSS